MKKMKLGSMEILGYIGIVIWVVVTLLRDKNLSDNNTYLFLLGVLPNVGAAWVFVVFGKWIIILAYKRKVTVKMHRILCISVVILAFISEVVHHMFLNSQFDPYDMLVTIIALIFMFFIPILIKDKSSDHLHQSNILL